MNDECPDLPTERTLIKQTNQAGRLSLRRFLRRLAQLPAYLSGHLQGLEARLDYHQTELRTFREDLQDQRRLTRELVAGEDMRLDSQQAEIAAGQRRLDRHDDQIHDQKVEIGDLRLESVKAQTETNRCVATLARQTADGLKMLQDSDQEVTALTQQLSNKVTGISALDQRIQLQSPWKPEDKNLAADPEFGLMGMLYSFVPSRIALDVGANTGRVSKVLLDAGFVVYAFEPFPTTYDQLAKSFRKTPNFKGFPFALGSQDGVLPLHITSGCTETSGDPSLYNSFRPHSFPEGLKWESAVEVPVRTIESLVKQGEVPKDIGLLKIDTEGYDLEVIRGMGELRPPIVLAEFWGDEFVFAKDRDPEAPDHPARLLVEMNRLAYWWSLTIYRINELGQNNTARFTANTRSVPKNAWGNTFFFRSYEPFIQAFRWCSLVLPGLTQ
jgi:FkbM family methyltransferase